MKPVTLLGLLAAGLGLTYLALRTPEPPKPEAAKPGLPLIPPPLPSIPPLPSAPGPVHATPAGLFPDLKVGDAVVVDPDKANLGATGVPFVFAVVDMVLTDRSFISVRSVMPPGFGGTIPRTAIVGVTPKLPVPGGLNV